MFIDPNGEVVWFVPALIFAAKAAITGAAIGAATYIASVAFSKGGVDNFSFSGLGKAMGFGALSGVATFGVGLGIGALGNLGKFGADALAGLAHGVTQGGISALQGGNFWEGMASGALSSFAASAFMKIPKVGNSTFGAYAAGGLAGGVGSKVGGGNFWQGFGIGVMNTGLNHFGDVLTEPRPISSTFIDDQTTALREMWNSSFERGSNYRVVRSEIAGFQVEGGYVVQKFHENTKYLSHTLSKGGQVYATHYRTNQGGYYKIINHIHTHPNPAGPNSIGISERDGQAYDKFKALNIGMRIIYNRTVYEMTGPNQNDYAPTNIRF